METIPVEFWMVIISVITLFLVYIMYQIANIIKESSVTVSEATKIVTELQETVRKANMVLDDASVVVSLTKDTVVEVQDSVIKPILSLASVFKNVSDVWSSLSSGFKSSK